MSHGGLPPRRPDQYGLPTPRGIAPGARISRIGGSVGSVDVIRQGPTAPLTLFTFPSAGRIFGAHLSFAAGSNASYTGSVSSLYAQLVLAISGIVLVPIELAICNPSQNANGDGDPSFPEAGLPVAAGEMIQVDVNNGVGLVGSGGPSTGGLIRASATVLYSIP